MPNPWGMAEFSVPQLLGLDMQLKNNRLQQMYLQRQHEREDVQWERQQRDWERQDKRDAALAKIYAPKPSTALAAPPADGQTSGSAPASSAPPTTGFELDQNALNELRATGADGLKMANDIQKLNAEQIKSAQEALKSSMEMTGRIVSGVRALPPEQRAAAYQAERAKLISSGVPAEQLPPVWDENVADQAVQKSITVAEAIGMKDAAARLAETVRHNRATEANAAGNLAVARGNLGVRQQALEQAKRTGSGASTIDLLNAAGLGD